MKMSDIKQLSNEELVYKELQLERDMIDARFKKELGSLENSAVFAVFRKDIARLRTEQRSREIASGLNIDTLRNTHRGSFNAAVTDSGEGSGSGFLKGISDKLNTDT
jgi:large subunit ribosomal protein L29